jgi:hypothetical protein
MQVATRAPSIGGTVPNKDDIADTLESIGLLLDLKGENAFKTRAYANRPAGVLRKAACGISGDAFRSV